MWSRLNLHLHSADHRCKFLKTGVLGTFAREPWSVFFAVWRQTDQPVNHRELMMQRALLVSSLLLLDRLLWKPHQIWIDVKMDPQSGPPWCCSIGYVMNEPFSVLTNWWSGFLEVFGKYPSSHLHQLTHCWEILQNKVEFPGVAPTDVEVSSCFIILQQFTVSMGLLIIF